MKRSIMIAMAAGVMGIGFPLAVCAQSTEYWWQCPPGSVNTVCVEINGYGQGKAYTLPAAPMTTPERAMGECAPDAVNRTCVEINGRGAAKAAWEFPPRTSPERAMGECAPDAVNRTCVEINGRGTSKAAWETPAIAKRGTSLAEWLK